MDWIYHYHCDKCKYYNWYYSRCTKWGCEKDYRSACSDYEPNGFYKPNQTGDVLVTSQQVGSNPTSSVEL